MFQKHEKYKQKSLLSVEHQLNKRQQTLWQGSFEAHFFELIFSQIDEGLFSVLFSGGDSRPNSPVNQLVAAQILRHRFGWSYAQLERELHFNLLSRMALGVQEVDESIFCERTMFNFQNRLSEYYLTTGVNLLEGVFDGLTAAQLKKLKLKTNIQRGDSFLAASNIVHYSRLQLLVEVLGRFHRILSDSDQQLYGELFAPYIKKKSNKYIYDLAPDSLPSELEQVGLVYHQLYQALKSRYGDYEVFRIFERVYQEHFTTLEDQIELKPNKSLSSSCLQSPDDLEATFRTKRGESSQGFSIHVSETAHPDNLVNLLSDVVVAANNVDDSKLLHGRLEKMKEKTPDLEEYHSDGGYGSEPNDELMQELGITQIQTAIRGRNPEVRLEIYAQQNSETETQSYEVHCQGAQKVAATMTSKRFKAEFDLAICDSCPFKDRCPSKQAKGCRTYYFTQADARKHQRWRNIRELPPERQRIRPNVESSVRQMKNNMKNHKLKVRGIFKATLYAFFSAMATNAARIAQYEQRMAKNGQEIDPKGGFARILVPCWLSRNIHSMYNPNLVYISPNLAA